MTKGSQRHPRIIWQRVAGNIWEAGNTFGSIWQRSSEDIQGAFSKGFSKTFGCVWQKDFERHVWEVFIREAFGKEFLKTFGEHVTKGASFLKTLGKHLAKGFESTWEIFGKGLPKTFGRHLAKDSRQYHLAEG